MIILDSESFNFYRKLSYPMSPPSCLFCYVSADVFMFALVCNLWICFESALCILHELACRFHVGFSHASRCVFFFGISSLIAPDVCKGRFSRRYPPNII